MNLTTLETTRLIKCEDVIKKGLNTFYEVGNALTEIRDCKLYRLKYKTFEDYCADQWNIKKSQAYNLINSSKAIENMSTIVDILPETEGQTHELTHLPPEEMAEVWMAMQKATGKAQPTAKEMRACIVAKNANLPMTRCTGDNEWFTPEMYVESARIVMGKIDLDPASNDFAQKVVQAEKYFTIETNSLDKPWTGNVWMNPPYSTKEIRLFTDKITTEKLTQAIVVTNSATDTGWWHQLNNWANALCWPDHRINFYKQDRDVGGSSMFCQTFFYYGSNFAEFKKEFSKHGIVMAK